jgi:inward rectifier potassium channel
MAFNLKKIRRVRPKKHTLGTREVVTHGLNAPLFSSIYHVCMTVRWPVFFAAIGGGFLLINLLFSIIYGLGHDPIANLNPSRTLGLFFFSVETLATVGYGDMHPHTLYGHVVATIEIFFGLIGIALITGLIFARFSRPRALIMTARHPVINSFEGKQTLTIRAANARQNVIVDASAKLRMIRNEVTPEGLEIRRLHDLKLMREQHPIFSLGWNLMHIIDDSSPLFGQDAASLKQSRAGLILTLSGVDETTSQTMMSRHMYSADAIRWNHRYVDLLSTDDEGINHMDFSKFHDIRPL